MDALHELKCEATNWKEYFPFKLEFPKVAAKLAEIETSSTQRTNGIFFMGASCGIDRRQPETGRRAGFAAHTQPVGKHAFPRELVGLNDLLCQQFIRLRGEQVRQRGEILLDPPRHRERFASDSCTRDGECIVRKPSRMFVAA